MEKLNWSTSDFYSAVLCRTYGIPLINLTREDGSFIIFHFKSAPATCEEILRKHWDRSLKLETRLLIETIKELRTRVHERMKQG